MTQEEKQLLLKDLCARLPYGVVVLVTGKTYFGKIEPPYNEELTVGSYLLDDEIVESIKPYLRPMSSMTEEEREEYNAFFTYDGIDESCFLDYLDWLNSHHFDYRCLIPKGLALEAPEDMYKTK